MPLRPGPHNASIRAQAAAWIVCAKEERKISQAKLEKNYQRMKEKKQKNNKKEGSSDWSICLIWRDLSVRVTAILGFVLWYLII